MRWTDPALRALRWGQAARWQTCRGGNVSFTEVRWHSQAGEVVRLDDRGHVA